MAKANQWTCDTLTKIGLENAHLEDWGEFGMGWQQINTWARMVSPEKLAPNIFFHSLYVPKLGWLRTAYQGCIRAVRKKLRELRPNIVHGQGTERDCAISAVFSGFPNVLTIHGNLRLIAKVTQARRFSFPWLGGIIITRAAAVARP